MPRQPPPHEVYALKLQCLSYGHALFEPDPSGSYDFVRIGDVGYISEHGKFIKLFNAFSDRDSPHNQGCILPSAFQPIAGSHRNIERLAPLTPGLYRSESVRIIGGQLGVTGYGLDIIQSSVQLIAFKALFSSSVLRDI